MELTKEMVEAVRAKATDGKITCPMLRKLADDHDIPYKLAGEAANEAGVRIKNCDLGCF